MDRTHHRRARHKPHPARGPKSSGAPSEAASAAGAGLDRSRLDTLQKNVGNAGVVQMLKDTSQIPDGTAPPAASLDIATPEAQVEGGVLHRILIDGDGDQRKELELQLRAVDTWTGAPIAGGVKTLAVRAIQRSTGTARTATFTVPRVDVGGRLAPVVADRVTDGRAPTRISLHEREGVQFLDILPGIHGPSATTYNLTVAGQSIDLAFPPEPTGMRRVGGAVGTAHGARDVTYLDLRLGAFSDAFRLAFHQKGDKVTMGVHVLTGGVATGGYGFDLTMLKGPIQPRVLPSGPTSVAIDVNGDGRPDVFIYDRLTGPAARAYDGLSKQAMPIVAGTRTHQLRITGPALANDETRTFHVTSTSRSSSGDYKPGTADKEAIRDLAADTHLEEQSHAGGPAKSMLEVDGAELATLGKAVADRVLPEPLFSAVADLRLRLEDIRKATDRGELFAQMTGAVEVYDAEFSRAVAALRRTSSNYAARVGVVPTKPSGARAMKEAVAAKHWLRANRAFTLVLDEVEMLSRDTRYYSGASPGRQEMRQMHNESEWRRSKRDVLLDVPQDRTAIDRRPGAIPRRLPAVFHPDGKYQREEGYKNAFDLEMYLWNDGKHWILKNATNPKRAPEFRAPMTPGETAPPQALFDALDDKDRFPAGVITYQLPGEKTTRRITVVERMTFRDFATQVALIGLGLLIPAGIAARVVGGTALKLLAITINETVSAVGTARTVWDIYDRIDHGDLDGETVAIDATSMVSSVFHYAAAAGRGGTTAVDWLAKRGYKPNSALVSGVNRLNWHYVELKAGEKAMDYATVALLAPLGAQRVEQIYGDPRLSDDEKFAAAQELVLTLAALGLLIVIVWRSGAKAGADQPPRPTDSGTGRPLHPGPTTVATARNQRAANDDDYLRPAATETQRPSNVIELAKRKTTRQAEPPRQQEPAKRVVGSDIVEENAATASPTSRGVTGTGVDSVKVASDPMKESKELLLAKKGVRVDNLRVGKGKDFSLDIENHDPGGRAGQLHLVYDGVKYYYNFVTKTWYQKTGSTWKEMTRTMARRFADEPAVQSAIARARKLLMLDG